MRPIRALPLFLLLGLASCANAPPAESPKLLDKKEHTVPLPPGSEGK